MRFPNRASEGQRVRVVGLAGDGGRRLHVHSTKAMSFLEKQILTRNAPHLAFKVNEDGEPVVE